nr:MAG TPA: hypothetical protein [Bacteriophage sp.]
MDEKILEQTEQEDEIDVISNLKSELAALKANTVSKEQYNKLKKAYAEGGSLASTEAPEPTRADKEKELKDTVIRLHYNQGTNLEQEQDLLRFRELYMDLDGRDPFNPAEGEVSPEDLELNERRAQLGRYAIEQSQGDTQSFSAIFGSNLKDVPGIKIKK